MLYRCQSDQCRSHADRQGRRRCQGVASKWSFPLQKSESEPYAVVVWEQELLAEPLRSGLLKHL